MPKKQKGFNVEVKIWTKEGVLRSWTISDVLWANYPLDKELSVEERYMLIAQAIISMRFPFQTIVQLDPFAITCPIGFIEIIQLGDIKISQFRQPTHGFQMFDGNIKSIKAASAAEIESEFLKQIQAFIQQINQLELDQAIKFEKEAQKCLRRSQSVDALCASRHS